MKPGSIKTQEDIAILAEGGRRHAEILYALSALVRPGVRTDELNTIAEEEVRKFGDSPSFLGYRPEGVRRAYPAALCVSINDEIVHGIPNENPQTLKEGDIVTLDLGLTHRGLVTDMAVTVPVGEISKEKKNLIFATREALAAGIAAAKAGNHIGDIGAAIANVARGRRFTIIEGLAGHGVGYAVHEDPYVPNEGTPGEGPELVPGLVLAIEPMLTTGNGRITLSKDGYTFKTVDKAPSTHCEHTIVITNGPAQILTEFTGK